MMGGRQAAGRGCVCQLRQLCALWDFTAENKTDSSVGKRTLSKIISAFSIRESRKKKSVSATMLWHFN